jgi:hypothetical protein
MKIGSKPQPATTFLKPAERASWEPKLERINEKAFAADIQRFS